MGNTAMIKALLRQGALVSTRPVVRSLPCTVSFVVHIVSALTTIISGWYHSEGGTTRESRIEQPPDGSFACHLPPRLNCQQCHH